MPAEHTHPPALTRAPITGRSPYGVKRLSRRLRVPPTETSRWLSKGQPTPIARQAEAMTPKVANPPIRSPLVQLTPSRRVRRSLILASARMPSTPSKKDQTRPHSGSSTAISQLTKPEAAREPGGAASRNPTRTHSPLDVVPKHVVHPDLLGGWRCRSPSNKEEPDEAPR